MTGGRKVDPFDGELTRRERDLLEAFGHLVTAFVGENAAYHLAWCDYHCRRACQGMPQDAAEALLGHVAQVSERLKR